MSCQNKWTLLHFIGLKQSITKEMDQFDADSLVLRSSVHPNVRMDNVVME